MVALCPKCKRGHLRAQRRKAMFGTFESTYQCDACAYIDG